MGDIALIEFELTAIPDSVYEMFNVEKGNPLLIAHELLCQAIHEGDDNALNALMSYVTNISLKV